MKPAPVVGQVVMFNWHSCGVPAIVTGIGKDDMIDLYIFPSRVSSGGHMPDVKWGHQHGCWYLTFITSNDVEKMRNGLKEL